MNTKRLTISANDKMNFFGNFSTMLTAGIPILETIDSLLEGSKGNLKKILEAIRADLVQGHHLYESLARFPSAFDTVTVNIIKASEEAGTLEVTLKDIRLQIQKDMEFRDKIKGALTYPVVILFVFIAVLFMILVVVIPKISIVFTSLAITLPLPTKILIFASDVVTKYTLFFLLGAAAIIILTAFIYRAEKKIILNMLFKLPLLSGLVKQIDLTRFSRSMYLLLTSGITINNSLDLCQQVVSKPEIVRAISRAKEVVLSGRKFSEGLKENPHIFSNIMIRIIEAGERTGTLDKSMEDISEHLDYEVSNSLKTVTTLIEPLMLLVVGGLVGGMMLAIIAPIYSLIGQIGTH